MRELILSENDSRAPDMLARPGHQCINQALTPSNVLSGLKFLAKQFADSVTIHMLIRSMQAGDSDGDRSPVLFI